MLKDHAVVLKGLLLSSKSVSVHQVDTFGKKSALSVLFGVRNAQEVDLSALHSVGFSTVC